MTINRLAFRNLALITLTITLMVVLAINSTALVHGQDEPEQPSQDLRLAFVSNRDGSEDIFTMPWQGNAAPVNLTRHPARDWNPTWSDDGTQIAFNSDREGLDQIYVIQQFGGDPRPLFNNSTSHDTDPAWSPTGEWIAFVSNRDGFGRDLYVATPDGQTVQRVTTDQRLKGDPAWSPDGQSLIYWERQNNGEIHLYRINVDGTGRAGTGTVGPTNGAAAISPDGSTILFDTDRAEPLRWMLYQMGSGGQFPQQVVDLPGNSGRAAWSPQGNYITFTNDGGNSDELYLVRADGSSLQQLTDNTSSDHSAVWQPMLGAPPPAILPTSEPSANVTAIPGASDVVASQFSTQVQGIEVFPVQLPQLLQTYGFEQWHAAGWRGENVRVGVIDLGFRELDILVQQTGAAVVLPFGEQISEYSNQEGENDHGTNVLEVIHAVAPDALLYACNYDGTYDGLATCTDFMRESNVDIINHSAGLPLFPLNGENKWAQLARRIQLEEGILWVNSAGNYHNSFVSGNFSDLDGDGYHDFAQGGTVAQNRIDLTPTGDYEGYVILTWDDPNRRVSIDATDEQPPLPLAYDFHIEVLDSANEVIFTTDPREEANETEEPANAEQVEQMEVTEETRQAVDPAKRLFVQENGPFAVRIYSANDNIQGQVTIPMLVFVEFLPVPGADVRGTVIAPADAYDPISVGAAQGYGFSIAPYSSRGVLETTAHTKPDLSAPGEIQLADGDIFIGTSAAAPVVAGAAALFLENDPQLKDTSALRNTLKRSVRDMGDLGLGSGILIMPDAPLPKPGFLQLLSGNIEPRVVFPQPQEEEATTEVIARQCQGTIESRMVANMDAYVIYNLGLKMRSGPGTQYQDLTSIEGLQLGDRFTVLSGPECVQNLSWWEIELFDGSRGWVAEGDLDYYWLAPVTLTSARLPNPTLFGGECTIGPPALLEIGERAEIVTAPTGGLTLWRDYDGGRIIGGMGRGTELFVLGGPNCLDGRNRWYVRVLNGQWQGNEGWTPEAQTGTRWIEPRSN